MTSTLHSRSSASSVFLSADVKTCVIAPRNNPVSYLYTNVEPLRRRGLRDTSDEGGPCGWLARCLRNCLPCTPCCDPTPSRDPLLEPTKTPASHLRQRPDAGGGCLKCFAPKPLEDSPDSSPEPTPRLERWTDAPWDVPSCTDCLPCCAPTAHKPPNTHTATASGMGAGTCAALARCLVCAKCCAPKPERTSVLPPPAAKASAATSSTADRARARNEERRKEQRLRAKTPSTVGRQAPPARAAARDTHML